MILAKKLNVILFVFCCIAIGCGAVYVLSDDSMMRSFMFLGAMASVSTVVNIIYTKALFGIKL